MNTTTGRDCISISLEATKIAQQARTIAVDLSVLSEMTQKLQRDMQRLSMKQKIVNEVFSNRQHPMQDMLRDETKTLASRASTLRRHSTTIGNRQEALDARKQKLQKWNDRASSVRFDSTLRMW